MVEKRSVTVELERGVRVTATTDAAADRTPYSAMLMGPSGEVLLCLTRAQTRQLAEALVFVDAALVASVVWPTSPGIPVAVDAAP